MLMARTTHNFRVACAVLYKERLYQRVRGYSHADAEVAPDPTSGWASPR